jgi:hypothetical protein
MPVLHESKEWRGLLKDVSTTKGELSDLRHESIDRHNQNRRDIDTIKDDVGYLKLAVFGNGTTAAPGIKTQVDRIETSAVTIKVTLKVIAWIIGTAILAGSLYVGSLEARHKISDVQTQTSKQDAGEPAYNAHPEVTNAK